METYIRKNIKGYYVEYPQEIDAEYWNGKIGFTYEDFVQGKWIHLSQEQVAFHQDNPSFPVKYVIEMEVPPVYERTLEDAKLEKLGNLAIYDLGPDVNLFIIRKEGQEDKFDWLTPDLRSNYRNSIESALLLNVELLSFYICEQEITLPTETAKIMLARIQLYADQCFIVTELHKATINSLETIEEIDAYDFTVNYPSKIVFEI